MVRRAKTVLQAKSLVASDCKFSELQVLRLETPSISQLRSNCNPPPWSQKEKSRHSLLIWYAIPDQSVYDSPDRFAGATATAIEALVNTTSLLPLMLVCGTVVGSNWLDIYMLLSFVVCHGSQWERHSEFADDKTKSDIKLINWQSKVLNGLFVYPPPSSFA